MRQISRFSILFRVFVLKFKSNDLSLPKRETMRIVSHRKLKEYYETPGREDSEGALERWYEITEAAQWHSFAEVKEDFGSVDAVGNQHYVFNIAGNKHRLVVVIKFQMGYVFIRFVGTHKEYETIDAKEI